MMNVIIAYYSLTKTIIMDELTLYEDKLGKFVERYYLA